MTKKSLRICRRIIRFIGILSGVLCFICFLFCQSLVWFFGFWCVLCMVYAKKLEAKINTLHKAAVQRDRNTSSSSGGYLSSYSDSYDGGFTGSSVSGSSSDYTGGFSGGYSDTQPFSASDYARNKCPSYIYGIVLPEEMQAIDNDPNLSYEQKAAAKSEADYLAWMNY